MPHMHISERRVGDVTILTLKGRLVLEEGDAPLREHIDALIREGRVAIVLNAHDVTYMDSCGIGALVAKYVSLRQRGGSLKLVSPSRRFQHLLDVTHLVSVFDTYDSEEAAVEPR